MLSLWTRSEITKPKLRRGYFRKVSKKERVIAEQRLNPLDCFGQLRDVFRTKNNYDYDTWTRPNVICLFLASQR